MAETQNESVIMSKVTLKQASHVSSCFVLQSTVRWLKTEFHSFLSWTIEHEFDYILYVIMRLQFQTKNRCF